MKIESPDNALGCKQPALLMTRPEFQALAPAAFNAYAAEINSQRQRRQANQGTFAAFLPVRTVRPLIHHHFAALGIAIPTLAKNALILSLPKEFSDGLTELVERKPQTRLARASGQKGLSSYFAYRCRNTVRGGNVEAWIETLAAAHALQFGLEPVFTHPYWLPIIAISGNALAVGGHIVTFNDFTLASLQCAIANEAVESAAEPSSTQGADVDATPPLIVPPELVAAICIGNMDDEFAIALDLRELQVRDDSVLLTGNSDFKKEYELRYQNRTNESTVTPRAVLVSESVYRIVAPRLSQHFHEADFDFHSSVVVPTTNVRLLVEWQWSFFGSTPPLAHGSLIMNLPDRFFGGLSQLVESGLNLFSLKDNNPNGSEIYGAFLWDRPSSSDSLEVWIVNYDQLDSYFERHLTLTSGEPFWFPVVAIAGAKVAVGGFFVDMSYVENLRSTQRSIVSGNTGNEPRSPEAIYAADNFCRSVGPRPWQDRPSQCNANFAALPIYLNCDDSYLSLPLPDEHDDTILF